MSTPSKEDISDQGAFRSDPSKDEWKWDVVLPLLERLHRDAVLEEREMQIYFSFVE